MVIYAFNPSTQEAAAGGSLLVPGEPSLLSELQESQDYKLKLYPQNKNKFKGQSI